MADAISPYLAVSCGLRENSVDCTTELVADSSLTGYVDMIS